jgi:hypothetical protein
MFRNFKTRSCPLIPIPYHFRETLRYRHTYERIECWTVSRRASYLSNTYQCIGRGLCPRWKYVEALLQRLGFGAFSIGVRGKRYTCHCVYGDCLNTDIAFVCIDRILSFLTFPRDAGQYN